jgi:hypothetical protein
MKILFKLVVVISALCVELVVLALGNELIFGLGHGQIADTRYRQKERVAAWIDDLNRPSPETKAKFREELRLMHKHEDWKMSLAVGVFFAINGVWIYYYFRGKRINACPSESTA